MSDVIGDEILSSEEPIRIRTWQEIIMSKEHKAPIQERIDAMTYIKPFPIKECDLLTIKRFIHFCRFNSKNDWGIGLKMLLDYVDADAKNIMIFDKMMQLEGELEGLKTEISSLKDKMNEKKERVGFGVKP
jgi:hypothetical protein